MSDDFAEDLLHSGYVELDRQEARVRSSLNSSNEAMMRHRTEIAACEESLREIGEQRKRVTLAIDNLRRAASGSVPIDPSKLTTDQLLDLRHLLAKSAP